MNDTQTMINHLLDCFYELTDYISNHPDQFLPRYDESRITPSLKKRFKHPAWRDQAPYQFSKNLYFYLQQHLNILTQDLKLEGNIKKKLEFFMQQFKESISPANFIHLNPEIIEQTLMTKGQNLIDGMTRLCEDFVNGRHLLRIQSSEKKAFVLGKNIACTPGKVIYQNECMQLLHYQPQNNLVHQRPILFIPPWINKYYILDLQPKNSLVKWLVNQNYNVFVISWINPNQKHRNNGFSEYMLRGAVQALKIIHDVTQQKINAVGYCTGGTLLGCLATYLAQKKIPILYSTSFLTTLFDFSEPGQLGIFIDEPQIQKIENQMQKEGYLSGKVLTSVFNLLRSEELIWSAFVNRYLKSEPKKPFDLLYWNDDSINVSANLHGFYLKEFYLNNKLVNNKLKVMDKTLQLTDLKTPSYFLAAKEDHIIPWQSSYASYRLAPGKTKFVLTESGHVAGVINPPQQQKYGFWTTKRKYADGNRFLDKATYQSGSWWTDWEIWLRPYAGQLSGNHGYDKTVEIEPAPGSYVRSVLN